MISTTTKTVSFGGGRTGTAWFMVNGRLHLVALGAILILAAVLRFANLAALGYGNHYYTAGVASMLQSWHNFFFVAAEPGGSVSIDKPPVGLWLQALSAAIFGVNGFGVLLPQIVAGILSVFVLYHLVRRSSGGVAGLLAALALAIMPVVVATDRNNTSDSILILTLLLAAWAFITATERGTLRYLLLGVTLVGIGFNIKMLQAYLPLPAFYALYLLGSSEHLRRKVINLALATVLLLTVSLSWAIAVDLTPADQRPYVGSSGTNSVINLMLGYNGIERLTGMGERGGLLSGLFGDSDDQSVDRGPQQPGADGESNPALETADSGFPQPGMDGGPGPRGGPGGGFPGTGQAGALRLFTTPLSKEMSWLLPFGLFSIGLLSFRVRPRWPIAPTHQAVVLWGCWLLTGGIFFSIAGFFHEYYLSILAAPLAALVAMGAVELWRIHTERPWLAIGLLLLATSATLGLQLATAQAFVGYAWWLAISIVLFVIGVALLVVATIRRWPRIARAGFITVVAALLITPGIWAALTTFSAGGNQGLPSAYSGGESRPGNGSDIQVNQELLDYLEANTQGMKYLMAVPSSHAGTDYVLTTGRPVLYLGGFSGQDQVADSRELASMVADGELRYISWGADGGPGRMGGQGNSAEISTWLQSSCVAVEGFTGQTEESFAAPPDGATPTVSGDAADGRNGGMPPGPGGGRNLTLYDCGG